MNMQEKKRQRIYDLLTAETKPKNIPEIIGVSLSTLTSPDIKPLWLRYMSLFRNKTNATSHQNICSLKTAIEKECLKKYFEGMWIILKASWNKWKKKTKKKQWRAFWINVLFCVYLVTFFRSVFKIKNNLGL